MITIVLLGKKQSGKSTVADILLESGHYESFAFADPLKDACMAITGCNRAVFDNPQYKDTIKLSGGLTPRQIMQRLGEGLKNKFGQDFFVKQMKHRLKSVSPDKHTIITDCRFPAEYDFLKDRGNALFIEVRRTDHPIEDTHISESFTFPVHFVLQAESGNHTALREGLQNIFNKLNKGKSDE